jgi:hypothetical protein
LTGTDGAPDPVEDGALLFPPHAESTSAPTITKLSAALHRVPFTKLLQILSDRLITPKPLDNRTPSLPLIANSVELNKG